MPPNLVLVRPVWNVSLEPNSSVCKLASMYSSICFFTVYGIFSCMSVLPSDYKLWPPSVRQQKSLPALRLSLLNSQQSLTQPPQQGVKPVPGGTPPAVVAGPAVCIRHPNSVTSSTGASALPAGTLGHAAAMVCMEHASLKRLPAQTHFPHYLHLQFYYYNFKWNKVQNDIIVMANVGQAWVVGSVNIQVSLNRYMCIWKMNQCNKIQQIKALASVEQEQLLKTCKCTNINLQMCLLCSSHY